MKHMTKYTGKMCKAFTMLELVLVIVVLGILAALAIPRLEQDYLQEAADAMLSNFRYTQHLALNDDKQMAQNPNWQQRYWSIAFAKCSDNRLFFRIGSDDDMSGGTSGLFAQTEAATDPFNGDALWAADNGNCNTPGISNNIQIGKKYGIASIVGSGGCAGVQYIGFDHLGRPHIGFGNSAQPDSSSYMNSVCTFTFTLDDTRTFQISIQPETGYAQIVGQNDS